jgi:hypothetical protein
MPELGPEDRKLVTLARSARLRASTETVPPEGAAVREDTGRTYVAGTVQTAGLNFTALQLALASALGSGARRFEAAVLVTEADEPDDADRRVLKELAVPVLHLASPSGTLRRTVPV